MDSEQAGARVGQGKSCSELPPLSPDFVAKLYKRQSHDCKWQSSVVHRKSVTLLTNTIFKKDLLTYLMTGHRICHV